MEIELRFYHLGNSDSIIVNPKEYLSAKQIEDKAGQDKLGSRIIGLQYRVFHVSGLKAVKMGAVYVTRTFYVNRSFIWRHALNKRRPCHGPEPDAAYTSITVQDCIKSHANRTQKKRKSVCEKGLPLNHSVISIEKDISWDPRLVKGLDSNIECFY